jgi:3-deoxy-manno-octulosonate cytidylyltransferase (CMP-KDO synthetase)
MSVYPSFTVLIPARMASSRLPNKPVADIAGLPMVVRVAQRAMASQASHVVVAADDPRIVQACEANQIKAVLTKVDHPSGSDRLAEACDLLNLQDNEIVVNVQGDEPLIDPESINAAAKLLQEREDCSMSTLAHAIDAVEDFANPNVVKVVLDAKNTALYFSRAPISWWRDGFSDGIKSLPTPAPLRHVGLYGYRVKFLREFPKLSQAPIEVIESLEQLRAMWHGHRIAVHIVEHSPGPGVDTPEDLARVRALFGVVA